MRMLKSVCVADFREIQRQLNAQGAHIEKEADETTAGPASFVAVNPDGNQF